MSGRKTRQPLHEVCRELVACATGKVPADVVIRSGRLVNVITGEILDGVDVAVRLGRIALVGESSSTIELMKFIVHCLILKSLPERMVIVYKWEA
jgi:adenine deaminase